MYRLIIILLLLFASCSLSVDSSAQSVKATNDKLNDYTNPRVDAYTYGSISSLTFSGKRDVYNSFVNATKEELAAVRKMYAEMNNHKINSPGDCANYLTMLFVMAPREPFTEESWYSANSLIKEASKYIDWDEPYEDVVNFVKSDYLKMMIYLPSVAHDYSKLSSDYQLLKDVSVEFFYVMYSIREIGEYSEPGKLLMYNKLKGVMAGLTLLTTQLYKLPNHPEFMNREPYRSFLR
jgi:hypothetical protein